MAKYFFRHACRNGHCSEQMIDILSHIPLQSLKFQLETCESWQIDTKPSCHHGVTLNRN